MDLLYSEHHRSSEEPAIESQSKPRPLSVSAALSVAKSALEEHTMTVLGEVSELSNKAGYKAVYFTVKDEQANLSCVMWMNRFKAANVEIAIGSLVEITGRFTLWAAKGRMNFDVFAIKLAGEGNLRMQVAKLARKLEAEGLMSLERKRPLPKYPETIGLVTSPRGAAVHDVLRTLRRRYPLARIIFAGVPVEGAQAPLGLIHALETVANSNAELILLVRGGGSFEDLMPFNDEALTRAICNCPVPVVTGIGHEPDTSIADMVADLRASTPTAAAEAASPRQENLLLGFDNAAKRLQSALQQRIDSNSFELEALASRQIFQDSYLMYAESARTLDSLGERLVRALPHNMHRDESALDALHVLLGKFSSTLAQAHDQRFDSLRQRMKGIGAALLDPAEQSLALGASRLEDLSPLSVLARGYAIARDESGNPVYSVDQVSPQQQLAIQVSDGRIDCMITGKEKQNGR